MLLISLRLVNQKIDREVGYIDVNVEILIMTLMGNWEYVIEVRFLTTLLQGVKEKRSFSCLNSFIPQMNSYGIGFGFTDGLS